MSEVSSKTEEKGGTVKPTKQFKALVIGDPHFKGDNATETDMMTPQLVQLIVTEDPDVVVVAGDILHKHEKVDLYPLKRAIDFLRAIHAVARRLVVLIGNHDRPNNNIYLTDEHSFNSLKEWPRTLVVDDVQVCNESYAGGTCRVVYVPYVPTGRFAEALYTKLLAPPYAGITAVFAHQEFKGAKMNAITSNAGDPWNLDNPICISGHIHDFDVLQPNLIYVGTPIQHGYADTHDKTVSIFLFKPDEPSQTETEGLHDRVITGIHEDAKALTDAFKTPTAIPGGEVKPDVLDKPPSTETPDLPKIQPPSTETPDLPKVKADASVKPSVLRMVKHQRVSLKIPKKKQITLTPEELARYVPEPLTHVKIKVEGDAAMIREVMKLDHVVKLAQTHGIKIVPVDTTQSQWTEAAIPEVPKVKLSFQQRLHNAVQLKTPEVRAAFKHLFG